MSKLFFDRNIKRNYLALVWGDLENNEGRIEGHIGRHKKNRKVMDVYIDGSNGKHAVTNYKVLERFGYTTLIQCKLETGRTHQIRVHMNYLGHSIVGDDKYKKKYKKIKNADETLIDTLYNLKRQFLHAKSLGFIHPKKNKEMTFDSILPKELEKVLKMLRKTNK